MILRIPIGDTYSEYLLLPEYASFEHNRSEKFEFIIDDYIDFLSNDNGTALRQLKFEAIHHECFHYEYNGYLASLKMNILDDLVHLVQITFMKTDLSTFESLNRILKSTLGNHIQKDTSVRTTNLFEVPAKTFRSSVSAYHSTVLYFKNGENLLCLRQSGHPKNSSPFITLTAYTRVGFYSQEDFNKAYKVLCDRMDHSCERFSNNFIIEGL